MLTGRYAGTKPKKSGRMVSLAHAFQTSVYQPPVLINFPARIPYFISNLYFNCKISYGAMSSDLRYLV